MGSEGLHLGGIIDAASGDRTGDLVHYDPADLTTHGVIVGMTGSGKTGLGIIFLEEALLSGIPTLVIDPKGDMTNLLLTFPDLAPADFEPWVDPAEARRENKDVASLAAEKAELWKTGLGWWDLDGERIRTLRDRADFTVYTPGSSAGVGINIVGSLERSELSWEHEAEVLRDEIEGFVSGLLGLVGIAADPISSREHILLSNLIEHAWKQGQDLDLASLLAQVHRPPVRKLGVFDVDTFFPEKDRLALAMKLNGLMASPAFAAWTEGSPLDLGSMLWGPDDKPRAAILYLAHLSEEERQFVVTLVLSKLVTWMRSQSGSTDLRALVYMDEVFGFVPPTAEPPAKKPILTLLKQARAFGVGMLLSTQNPVDLDYKAMSNAGTWCIGRLQTERDKARILEALKSASGTADVLALDAAISGLGKRQFLLHSTHEGAPSTFTTRWALSYLAGPLTRDQVARLTGDESRQAAPEPQAAASSPPTSGSMAEETASAASTDIADDETPVMPEIAEGVPVYHVDPAAPWLEAVGGNGLSSRLEAALAARVSVIYDDRGSGVDHREEFEVVNRPLSTTLDPASDVRVDYDKRDFTPEPPPNPRYVLPDAKLNTKTWFRSAESAIKAHLRREAKITVLRNEELDLHSRVGETREEFLARADAEAQRRADEEAAGLRDKYETKLIRVRDQLEDAERKVVDLEADLQSRRDSQLMESAGAVLGILLGRRSTRSVTGSARTRSAARTAERRLRDARAKADDRQDELSRLDTELREELEEINDRWEATVEVIDEVDIGLEKDDISVSELALVWVPVE